MAAPVIVQTCWRGQRTPPGVEHDVLHLQCPGEPHYLSYGHALADWWQACDVIETPGMWVIEHDVAVDPGDARRMLEWVAAAPEQVWAARYTIWPVSTGLPKPMYLPWTKDGYRRFGLGCTYLPAQLLDAVHAELATWDYPRVDAELSDAAIFLGIPVGLAADVAPKHLNY